MSSCCATGPKLDGHYDLAVVGAGSAGFSAAIAAADQGAQVALIGHGTLGGTCVNVGCVPSKALIRAVESLHCARMTARFAGLRAKAELRDWQALIAQKDELVAGLRQARYADLLPTYNSVAYIEGPARLTRGGIAVNGELVHAPKVIIATGARPAVPAIPGIEDVDYLTSTSALDLKQLPRSLLVVGGGYVGAELAQAFARTGVNVTIVCRSRLLPSRRSASPCRDTFEMSGSRSAAVSPTSTAGGRTGALPSGSSRVTECKPSRPSRCWSQPAGRRTSRGWGSLRPAWRSFRTAASRSTSGCARP